MKDYITLGPTPCDEDCAQVGAENYYEISMQELKRYKELILKKFGQPPDEAIVRAKSFQHDYGTYHELVVEFDDNNADAINYAFACENNLPATWDDNELVNWRLSK